MRARTWLGHLATLLAVALPPVLAATGLIGAPKRERGWDQKQVTVWRVGPDALRIREVIDADLGTIGGHGIQRAIPEDFGVPTDVTVTSPDASASFTQLDSKPAATTWIRIGDPSTTITGKHRWELTYTLPASGLSSGNFALDIIGVDDELPVKRMEIDVVGMTLATPRCSVGALGTQGGCDLRDAGGGVLQAVVEPLIPYVGVTVSGDIDPNFGASVAGDAVVQPPPRPVSAPERRLPLALGVLAVELVIGGLILGIIVLLGRDEVAAGGPADAAYGGTVPWPDGDPPPPAPTTLVRDGKLAQLATIEFSPPAGIEPWEGSVLLTEELGGRTTTAWFGQRIARGVLELRWEGTTTYLRPGPHADEQSDEERELLGSLFDDRDELELGKPDERLGAAARRVRIRQFDRVKTSGWWRRLPNQLHARVLLTLLLLFGVMGSITLFVLSIKGLMPSPASPVLAVCFGGVLVATVLPVAYLWVLPSRSAAGSALALRTESFRRFLRASEARHVEWAWQHGLLREYTVWATALGEADAWQHALSASSVRTDDLQFDGGLLTSSWLDVLPRSYGSVASTTVGGHRSSSSGFSSSFGGGSVGSGGGGGSSSFW